MTVLQSPSLHCVEPAPFAQGGLYSYVLMQDAPAQGGPYSYVLTRDAPAQKRGKFVTPLAKE